MGIIRIRKRMGTDNEMLPKEQKRKHHLAILIILVTKKCDIWWPKLFASSLVRSIQKGQPPIDYGRQILHVPLKSLIKYTCVIHEHISYELNFDVHVAV